MAEQEFSQEGRKSKYNSAISQLYRIDTLYQDAHHQAKQINYNKWNENLDRVWAELAPDVKPAGVAEIKVINEQLKNLCIFGLNPKLRKSNPKLYAKLMNLQKETLMRKEIRIRQIQNEQGLGKAYQDTMEDYMNDGWN